MLPQYFLGPGKAQSPISLGLFYAPEGEQDSFQQDGRLKVIKLDFQGANEVLGRFLKLAGAPQVTCVSQIRFKVVGIQRKGLFK